MNKLVAEESEWKELKIDDLPSDILTGKYQFQHHLSCGDWIKVIMHTPNTKDYYVLKELESGVKTRYRKRQQEKKVPSHEEIIKKWWKTDKNDCWVKPVQYFDGFYGFANTVYPIPVKNQCKEWFIGRESADIPPENAE